MAIELKQLSKHYGDKVVVDQISLCIEQGKITAFIGPNGAGKSTLLGMMSRLLPSSSGEVWLDGELLNQKKNSDIAKQLAILKQSNHNT